MRRRRKKAGFESNTYTMEEEGARAGQNFSGAHTQKVIILAWSAHVQLSTESRLAKHSSTSTKNRLYSFSDSSMYNSAKN